MLEKGGARAPGTRCTTNLAFTRLFYFEAVVHETTMLSFPPPTCIARPGVQHYCTIIGQYTTPPPDSRSYAIHHTILVITTSCKGQPPTHRWSLHEIALPTVCMMNGKTGGRGENHILSNIAGRVNSSQPYLASLTLGI